jgi:hypothetical protein
LGIRKGFFFGFLIGSVAGSVASKPKAAEAPPTTAVRERREPPVAIVDRVKRRAAEVMAEARQAAADRENELLRQLDEMRK